MLKKALIIILYIFVFWTVIPQNAHGYDRHALKKKGVIEDELLDYQTFRNLTPQQVQQKAPIVDDLLHYQRLSGDVFQLEASKSGQYERQMIEDELISETHNADFIKRAKQIRKIMAKNKYDFNKKIVPITIRIAKHFTVKNGAQEGGAIPFVSVQPFEIMNKKYDKGTTIWGRIETISHSDKMGCPESVKIDNFYIDEEEDINLHGAVSKSGANRSIWVYPLYQAGNIAFYAAGFIFVPIHGGRVKISTQETFTVFFEYQ